MLSKKYSSKQPARVKPGFALISVISLIVLLALVAVALLTLSNVSLRTSSLDDNEAKENAKLALII